MTDAGKYNGVTLAYIGDAVIELYVRCRLLDSGYTDSGKLSALALKFVTAAAQSEAFLHVEALLDEEEADIYRRGRNANITHHPKHQKLSDYRRATGFEALMGYLHLAGREARAKELFEKAYEKILENFKFND